MAELKYVGPTLEVYGEEFHSDITIPAATSTAGTVEIACGGVMGALGVAVVANGDIAIADTKKVTLTIKTSETEGGTYTTAVTTQPVFTAAGAATFSDGEMIGKAAMVPEPSQMWWKVDVATDDAGATGKINVVPYYLPR